METSYLDANITEEMRFICLFFILLYRQVPSKHLDLTKLPESEAEASDDSKGVSETNI